MPLNVTDDIVLFDLAEITDAARTCSAQEPVNDWLVFSDVYGCTWTIEPSEFSLE